VKDAKGKLGFDAQNEAYVDLIAAGIVDLRKWLSLRCATRHLSLAC